jgi:hypothetical protein
MHRCVPSVKSRVIGKETKQFVTAMVGDPEVAKKELLGVRPRRSRFSEWSCIVPGLDTLSNLDVILCGGHGKGARPSGISLLRPDGPLNRGGARHLYLASGEFCERLAALTNARILEIATDWYRLLYPFMSPDDLPIVSTDKLQYSEQTLRALAQLAAVAIKRRQRLMLYVENRRGDKSINRSA